MINPSLNGVFCRHTCAMCEGGLSLILHHDEEIVRNQNAAATSSHTPASPWTQSSSKIFFILQAFDHEDNSDFSQWVKYPQWDRLIKILNSTINFSENTPYTTEPSLISLSPRTFALSQTFPLAAFVSLYTCSQFQHQSWEIYREIMTPA